MNATDRAMSSAPRVLRTPESRFGKLPGYAFAPHWLDETAGFPGARMHYLDEAPAAPRKPEAVLCLHGHPTWSYLFRRTIPRLTAAGYRAVAPDLPGFGKSDKPEDEALFTVEALRGAIVDLIERLALDDAIIVGHDWGAALALTLAAALPGRVSGLVLMNFALPTGDRRLPDGVIGWRRYNADNPDLNVPGLMAKANRVLTFGECRAYGAPFPDASYKAAVRALPRLLAEDRDAPGAALLREARDRLGESWRGASQFVWGLRDPVHGHSILRALHGLFPGSPKPIALDHAGHFLPEWGEEFIDAAMASIAAQIAARRAAEAAETAEAGPERAGEGEGTSHAAA